jgi:hypothetical protein
MPVNQRAKRSEPKGRIFKLAGIALSLVLLLITGCTSGSGEDSNQRTTFVAEDVYTFNNLAKMVATTEVIVIGTVADVTKGRVVGPPGEEVQYLDTTLDVEKVLAGDVTDTQLTVETLELEVYEFDWRQPGERLVAFLSPSGPEAGGRLYPTNSQSIFVVGEGDELKPWVDDAFVRTYEGMLLDDFMALIEKAKAKVSGGKVSPQGVGSE